MKRFISLLMIISILFCFTSCGQEEVAANDLSVALITDFGNVDDHSFNQTTYEACVEWCNENNSKFTYYRPKEDSSDGRTAKIIEAIGDGYNVIVLPGDSFSESIFAIASDYPNVKFIAIDVDVDPKDSKENVYCATYHEELCGYMAGYAAVKLGYKNLGFIGGKDVPPVVRYGYGYIQGADAAAKELGIKIEMKFGYTGQFFSDDKITERMNRWYQEGTEVVFTCGGAIWESVAEAASKNNGKVIGVDVDQREVIDGAYGEGITLTSAMKGLGMTVSATLDKIDAGIWPAISGHVAKLGIISGRNPENNYVQLPPKSTQFVDGKFTMDEYKELVTSMYNGDLKVSDRIDEMPEVKNTTIIKD